MVYFRRLDFKPSALSDSLGYQVMCQLFICPVVNPASLTSVSLGSALWHESGTLSLGFVKWILGNVRNHKSYKAGWGEEENVNYWVMILWFQMFPCLWQFGVLKLLFWTRSRLSHEYLRASPIPLQADIRWGIQHSLMQLCITTLFLACWWRLKWDTHQLDT